MQREPTVAAKPGVAMISPKRSLPPRVQFRHSPDLRTHYQSFCGEVRFLQVAADGAVSMAIGLSGVNDSYRLSFRHSITSSARNRIDFGIVMPIALAVFRLTAKLNREGS